MEFLALQFFSTRTAIGQPEFIIRNFHKSLAKYVMSALMSTFECAKEGTPVENNHGVNIGNAKFVCLTPSTSEKKLLKEEFVTAPGERYGKSNSSPLFHPN